MEKYEVISKIGSGSYGEVSLIQDKKTSKKYVVKKVSLLGTWKERKAAMLEVKLLQTLKHPNIVSYHDSVQSQDGHLQIVMAYCEGGDLCRYLKKRKEPLDEQQLVEWLVQTCMALQYLHSKNILHRLRFKNATTPILLVVTKLPKQPQINKEKETERVKII